MQKKGSGLGNIGGMGESQTYWDKNKGRSLEGALERYSKLLGAAFMILSLVLCFVL
jgi:preprotein translocase subunit SecG